MPDKLSTKPYKGSRDFYPEEMRVRDWMFQHVSNTVELFGYEKIDAPLIEPIDIYLAKTSQEIVDQQMYSFTDRGERQVAIRPEMTPTVSRMVAARVREMPRPIRWYSIPNLWRYERPGKGRLREHWQLNCDLFGTADQQMADMELLQLAVKLLTDFGADSSMFEVRINHRLWLNFVLNDLVGLNETHAVEVARVMDKKDKISPEAFSQLLQDANCTVEQINLILEYCNEGESFLKRHGENEAAQQILAILAKAEKLKLSDYISYDPSIIRGFDYYTGMIFEVSDKHPENNRSLFGGGRYDNLVGLFSKESINACGFGMGDVTLQEFLTIHGLIQSPQRKTTAYVAWFPEPELQHEAFLIASNLRSENISVEMSMGPTKLAKQFDEAQRKNIPFVIVCGSNELDEKVVVVKDLRSGSQVSVARDQLLASLQKSMAST